MNQLPNTDFDLERRFVATKLLGGELLSGNDINPEDLSSPKLQEIYRVCLYLDANMGKYGFEDVLSQLEQDGKLSVVGRDYLWQLGTSTNEVILNVKPQTERLRLLARARRKREKLQNAIVALDKSEYDKADKEILDLSETLIREGDDRIYSAIDLANETTKALESMRDGKSLVIKTGLRMFDRFAGGLFPGGMLVIATYPNIGKSQLALLICKKVADSGLPTALLSLEDPPILTGSRLASHVTGQVSSKSMFTGEYERERIESMIEIVKGKEQRFRDLPLYMSQCGAHSPSEITDSAIKLIKERGCKLLALDYVQSVKVGDRAKRNEALAEVASQLKALCSRYGVTFVCCSQLTVKEASIYREPTPDQIRDTRDLWQIAEQMVMLWKTAVESAVNWRLVKSKIGNVGVGGIVSINTQTGMFDDLVDRNKTGDYQHWQD